MKTCPRCGTDQNDGAVYCGFCHYEFRKKNKPFWLLGIAAAIVIVAAIGSGVTGVLTEAADTQQTAPEEVQTQENTETETADAQTDKVTVAGGTDTGEQVAHTAESTYEIYYEDCTWQQAFDRCIEKGGSLVAFETEEEYQKVLKMLDSTKIYYIGAGRAENAQNYYWVNSDRTLSDISLDGSSHWLDGEPSLTEGDVGEFYVNLFYMKKQGKWVWNDIPNDTIAVAPNYQGKVGYICEYAGQ